jgi:hypothetical protein
MQGLQHSGAAAAAVHNVSNSSSTRLLCMRSVAGQHHKPNYSSQPLAVQYDSVLWLNSKRWLLAFGDG